MCSTLGCGTPALVMGLTSVASQHNTRPCGEAPCTYTKRSRRRRSVDGRRAPPTPRPRGTQQSTLARPIWPSSPTSQCAGMRGHDRPKRQADVRSHGRLGCRWQGPAASVNGGGCATQCITSGASVVALSAGTVVSQAAACWPDWESSIARWAGLNPKL